MKHYIINAQKYHDVLANLTKRELRALAEKAMQMNFLRYGKTGLYYTLREFAKTGNVAEFADETEAGKMALVKDGIITVFDTEALALVHDTLEVEQAEKMDKWRKMTMKDFDEMTDDEAREWRETFGEMTARAGAIKTDALKQAVIEVGMM